MLYPLFGTTIQVKERGCAVGSAEPRPIVPSVNLFVKVTDVCNARCRFCSNAGATHRTGPFDVEKLWRIVDELQRQHLLVNRLNITGGEPSVVPDLVETLLERADREAYRGIHLHLNTNGLLPESKRLMRHPRWDSVSVSLHHYDRAKLSELYGTRLPDDALDFAGVDPDKVNASCNLMRGYIDRPAEVERMLQCAVGLSLPRLGFVALMQVNDYCKARHVDFTDIDFAAVPHLYFTESRHRGTDCKCSNYLYNHAGRILEVYMRNYANFRYCESSLLYDGEYLRQGFHDHNIIY